MLEYICSAIQEKTTNSASTKYAHEIRELILRISYIYNEVKVGSVRFETNVTIVLHDTFFNLNEII